MGMRKTGITHIHEEILFTILSLLPAKSLLLCTAVCKLWKSIISDPQFITTHLANAHKKQTRFSVLATRGGEPHYHMQTHAEESVILIRLPPQSQFPGNTVSLGSCNGLLCLYNSNSVIIHLWNPSTKRMKMIPRPTNLELIHRWPYTRGGFSDLHYVLGFGYDSTCDDYKILRIIGFSRHEVKAVLYSSNADSWKEIQVPETVRNTMLSNLPKCVQLKDGVIYMEGHLVLLAFDLHNEMFGVNPYPLDHVKKSNALKFEDSVAMIFESSSNGSVSLWTLDDVCGCKGSWSKKLNLDEATANWERVWVHIILGVGQIVMREYVGNHRHHFYLYDYRKKSTKKVLSGQTCGVQNVVPDVYTESLVNLEGFQSEVEFE